MPCTKAGYFAWELYPKHRIFMDLELALFDDVSAYESMMAFEKTVVLQHHIEKYHPTVIFTPFAMATNEKFEAALDGYRPVFFDDFGVIFLRNDPPHRF